MIDFDGKFWVVEYEKFILFDDEKFILFVDGYYGNVIDGLGYGNRMGFSVIDKDNDGVSFYCVMYYMVGWWYKYCYYGNLNGRYDLGMVWYNFEIDEWI